MATPGMRWSASLMLRSGSALMSSAVIESTKTWEVALICWAFCRLWRMPVTTTSLVWRLATVPLPPPALDCSVESAAG